MKFKNYLAFSAQEIIEKIILLARRWLMITNWNFPQDEQKQIVDAHNDLRRKVAKGQETQGANGSGPQPKAADMFQLSWDPVLAASAQRLDYDMFNCKVFTALFWRVPTKPQKVNISVLGLFRLKLQ